MRKFIFIMSSFNRATRVIFVVLMCLMNSCSTEKGELFVMNIDSPTGSIDLKLSDLLSDIRIIPLETKDDVLLTTKGAFKVSSKYIVYYSSSEMHLFDKDGKHLRLLTAAGGGPNEFRQIINAFIDEENDIFYYTDVKNRTALCRINLLNGTYLEPIEREKNTENFSMADMDNVGNIYGFFPAESLNFFSGSNKNDTSNCYITYKYNVNKNTIEGVEVSRSYISSGLNRSVSGYGDGAYIYDSSYADTLFFYRKNKVSPAIIVRMKDIITDLQAGGNTCSINIVYEGGFLLKHSHPKVDIRTGISGNIESISVVNPTNNYFLADNKNGGLFIIKNFYIDPIGATINITKAIDQEQRDSELLNIDEFVKKSGDYGFCLIDAFKMESLIEEALAGDKLSGSEKEALSTLGAGIDEDSNPVVITGKIR